MTIIEEIRQELFRLSDEKYRDFQKGLIPTAAPESFIGVRTPALRAYARELKAREDISVFLADLPHRYYDENQLHAMLVNEIKDFGCCLDEVTRFLPFVDNWAVCDQLRPKVFRRHLRELPETISGWLASDEPYTVRFGIENLMTYFLDEDFDPAYPEAVAALRSDEYYVNMMIAWYFATALAKQYDAVIPYIENRRLDRWCHNKAIQKSVESFRITPGQKEYLKSLKIKNTK